MDWEKGEESANLEDPHADFFVLGNKDQLFPCGPWRAITAGEKRKQAAAEAESDHAAQTQAEQRTTRKEC